MRPCHPPEGAGGIQPEDWGRAITRLLGGGGGGRPKLTDLSRIGRDGSCASDSKVLGLGLWGGQSPQMLLLSRQSPVSIDFLPLTKIHQSRCAGPPFPFLLLLLLGGLWPSHPPEGAGGIQP